MSDEIHHDLVLSGHRHTPTAAVSAAAAELTVTLSSATKSFNLPAFAVTAAEAAYRHGEPWLEALLRYVEGNSHFLREHLAQRLPSARVIPLEGTYLAWVDLRSLGLTDHELKERLLRKAHVWLDDGPMFGTGGEGFQRVNLACPRTILEEALEQITAALGG